MFSEGFATQHSKKKKLEMISNTNQITLRDFSNNLISLLFIWSDGKNPT